MAFHHSVTARFFEIDRAGIVFFGRFFEYCHTAFEEMLTAMFGPLEQSFAAGRWPMPVVHSEADFHRPVRVGDRLAITLTVAHVGQRSITFAYALKSPDGALHAEAKLVHVCIDPATFAPCPVPAPFIAGLERLGLLPTVTTPA